MKLKLGVVAGALAFGMVAPPVGAAGEVRVSGHLTVKDGTYYCFGKAATIFDTNSDDVRGEWVYGTAGDDVIVLIHNGTNFVRARGGDDLICGGSGADYITDESRGYDGGGWVGDPAGNDKIDVVAGDDSIDLLGGVNVVHLGDGNDRAMRVWTPDPGDVDKVYGGRGNDFFDFRDTPGLRVVIDAGPGDDNIRGSTGDDILDGGAGADHIVGKEGYDRCIGGPGNDHFSKCEVKR